MLSLRRAPVFAVVAFEQLARFNITGDLLFDGIKVDDSINACRDVAEMTQRGREMIDLDVGIGSRAGLNAVQKVGVMGGEVGTEIPKWDSPPVLARSLVRIRAAFDGGFGTA